MRADDEIYRVLNAQSSQVTLKRLDLAFQAFFRRVKSGGEPGFPRFTSFERFSGWGYKNHGDGFRLTPGDGNQHGKLRLSGIGSIRVRGRARTYGEVKTCEIQHKHGSWYASLTIECERKRTSGTKAMGFDWGVTTFATIAREDGEFEDGEFAEIGNPRFFKRHEASVTRASRYLDECTVKDSIGRPTNGKDPKRIEAKRAFGRAKAREANARKDFLHRTSTKIIAENALIATETLQIKSMTGSASGRVDRAGKNVAQKAGLNREILATAPAAFLSMLKYKADEAGAFSIETPTKTLKPSQRCSNCGLLPKVKKALSERQHLCECGCVLTRDQNAARNNLRWALNYFGREPARNAIHRRQPWVA